MKTIIRRVLMTSLFLSVLGVFKLNAGQEGNGGGGVKRHGKLMSFYSAGIRTVNSGVQSKKTVPGLEELLTFIDYNVIYTRVDKEKLFSAITPAIDRNYYDIDGTWLTEKEKARIIEEYARVTGQPKEELVLYAVTDTDKRDTFLFPDFYKLPLNDQIAILYHEAQWILNPRANYKNIINKEIAFQAYLEDPTSINRTIDLALSESYAKVMELALNSDKNKQLYNEELKAFTFGEQKIPFTTLGLAGNDFLKCSRNFVKYESDMKGCQVLLLQHARKLHMSFPQSAFLYLWYKNAASFGISYEYNNGPSTSHERYSDEDAENILSRNSLFMTFDTKFPYIAFLGIKAVKEENILFKKDKYLVFYFKIKFDSPPEK